MSDLVEWVKEQVRKSGNLKEFIKTHTGLAPPAFIAVVALAAAGTVLTISAVSSLLAPPKKSDKTLDAIIEEEIMPFTPSNHREGDVIPIVIETPVEEAEEEAPANDFEAPVEEVEALVKDDEEEEEEEEEEEVSAEEVVKPEAFTEVDGEDNISLDYVEAIV